LKTVLLTVPRGWDVRSLMRTGVVDTMVEAGVRPVVVSPKAREPEFRREFERFEMDEYTPYLPPRIEGAYRRSLNVMYSVRFPDHSLSTNARRLAAVDNKDRLLKRAFYSSVRRAAEVMPILYDAAKKLEPLMPAPREARKLFEKWKPDAVITTPLFDWTDIPILKWSRRLGVPCASIVASWDNVSTKGTIQIRPDALVVWNGDMKHEACATHGYPEDRVAVTGVPHFDHWAEPGKTPRDEFMRRYGLDPSKKLILYCGAGGRVHPNEYEVFEHLVQANENGAFGGKLPIFLRLHPREYRPQWDRYRDRPGIVVDKPAHTKGKDWDADRGDLDHLADTLRAGDVSMNVCSTVTIEACIGDKAVFNIGYDGDQTKSELESAARHYKYTHFKRVVDCGIPVASSREHMIELTRSYLNDPARHREERRRVVDALVGAVGGAADRMGRALASFVLNGPSGITKF
jgi:hypothetical protein